MFALYRGSASRRLAMTEKHNHRLSRLLPATFILSWCLRVFVVPLLEYNRKDAKARKEREEGNSPPVPLPYQGRGSEGESCVHAVTAQAVTALSRHGMDSTRPARRDSLTTRDP